MWTGVKCIVNVHHFTSSSSFICAPYRQKGKNTNAHILDCARRVAENILGSAVIPHSLFPHSVNLPVFSSLEAPLIPLSLPTATVIWSCELCCVTRSVCQMEYHNFSPQVHLLSLLPPPFQPSTLYNLTHLFLFCSSFLLISFISHTLVLDSYKACRIKNVWVRSWIIRCTMTSLSTSTASFTSLTESIYSCCKGSGNGSHALHRPGSEHWKSTGVSALNVETLQSIFWISPKVFTVKSHEASSGKVKFLNLLNCIFSIDICACFP